MIRWPTATSGWCPPRRTEQRGLLLPDWECENEGLGDKPQSRFRRDTMNPPDSRQPFVRQRSQQCLLTIDLRSRQDAQRLQALAHLVVEHQHVLDRQLIRAVLRPGGAHI